MFRHTRLPGESAEYLAAREELRHAEIDLMRHREEVAARRRALPPGPEVDDYVFLEGPADLDAGDTPVREVTLSRLFTGPGRPLIVYHFMYGKRQTSPCPMCTLWIDGYNGIAHHLAQNADLVVVAAADPPVLRQHARTRGWSRLRLLSCGDSTFKYDLGSEDADGVQDSTVSVFTRDADGTVRHFYSARPRMAEDVDQRGIDLLCPVWHLLDLTPGGRGEWFAELDY
ncbi:DUF899 family protein [Streptomyces sp. NPDC046881]|uniref:DUF899 family protein n=1 Tax=Streptomyces sp. NPDC046881 TaxID=3155374 RepID=UPI0033FC9D40